MTRRIVTLTALLGIAGTIAFGITALDQDAVDREALDGVAHPATSSLVPPLSPVVGADRGAEDGDLDGGTVSVDSDEPAVSRLDPGLRVALQAAALAAARDGIQVQVSSGWRSRDYQQRLLDEAIATYGSREDALRWVATPDRSAHVTGDAVDVSPTDAAYWMSENGAAFGLCQTYANEIWHYELLTSPGGTCPTPLVDGLS